MAEATHRAAIKTLVQSVSNVGLVYDYLRFTRDQDKFLSYFKTTIGSADVIRGWMITCTAIPQEGWLATGEFNTGNKLSFPYIIHGYFSVDDVNGSEKTAFGIAEQVLLALTSDTLYSADVVIVTPPSLAFNYQMFGGVLCHHAEIRLTIVEVT